MGGGVGNTDGSRRLTTTAFPFILPPHPRTRELRPPLAPLVQVPPPQVLVVHIAVAAAQRQDGLLAKGGKDEVRRGTELSQLGDALALQGGDHFI